MTYRKFKADYLFTGREMAEKDAVLITTEDGTVQAILPAAEAGEGIEQLRGALSPGFINCHCHLELSHLKEVLPERTGMVDFLLAVMQQRGASPEFIGASIDDAEESMLHNGIVAVGDICNTTHTLARKTEGRLYYHNFIETMGFIEQTAPDRFENSRRTFEAFARAGYPDGAGRMGRQEDGAGGGISRNSLVPHAPYSVSPRLFGLIADFPGNDLLTIHNQESEAENEFYRSGGGDFLRLYRAMALDTSFFTGTGKRSLESYLPFFYKKSSQGPGGPTGGDSRRSLILVHNVATNEEDLQFALGGVQTSGILSGAQQEAGTGPALFFCLCPNANLYISGELPDVEGMMRHHCAIVIGTDSLASNHQLSILEELKTLQRQWPQLSTPVLLQWATSNGAKALRVDSLLGSFTPGKRPGLVLIEGLEDGKEGAGDWKFTPEAAARRLL
ncbi:MAG TPA: amidohydrolase family protein [Puia sp.]|nr:amidohydrolase family protein [Puia sp.]